MTAIDDARARTERAFEAVRRRMRVGAGFVVAAHAGLGAAFGAALAWMGEGGPWMIGVLSILGAAGSGAWAAGRLPAVAAGRLIERRFPECRNVLVTADEILSGELDVSDAARDRVFTRASEIVARIEPVRAAMIKRRVALSSLVILASLSIVGLVWRTLP